MNKYILDASAVLALINKEVGWEKVYDVFSDSYFCSVNLSEVVAKLVDINLPEAEITKIIKHLNLKLISFNYSIALRAGLLKSITKTKGLSLGDRACIATAIVKKLPILTADKIWKEIPLPVEIILIR
jgi:PIN domain nuclease of toxin-antitoxin system